MDNQKINCNVESCKFNNCNNKECELHQINVKACKCGSTGNPEDESMCGNYKMKK